MPSGIYPRTEKHKINWFKKGQKPSDKTIQLMKNRTREKSSNWKGGNIKVNCLVCGKEFYIKPSWKGKRGFYCSRKCFMQSEAYLIKRKKTLTTGIVMERICLCCGKNFTLLKSALTKPNSGSYCSVKCRRNNMPKGENAYNWKGGLTSFNQKIRTSIEMRLLREAVFARDNWICQKCKKKGEKLNAHHIKPFAKYPELRFAIDNGITLCKECHRKEPCGRQINIIFK